MIFKENEEHCHFCGCPKIYAEKVDNNTTEYITKFVPNNMFRYQCIDCGKVFEKNKPHCPSCGCPNNFAKKIYDNYLENNEEKTNNSENYPRYSEDDIKSLVEKQITYKKGYDYYLQKRVRLISQDLQNGIYKSTVIGSNNNVYNCQLNFDKNRLKSHLCNCPAHSNYYGPCKHIVATMLSIRELRLSKRNLTNAKESCQNSAQNEKKLSKTTAKINPIIQAIIFCEI